jgi:hypothetical protein
MHQQHWESRFTELFGSHVLGGAAVTVAGFALSFAIAYASFEGFERPVLKLKRYFEYRSDRKPLAAA